MVPKKNQVKFAVVAENGSQLSNIWRVWSHQLEVYLGVQSILQEFKTSLHSSGKWRHAFTTQDASRRFLGPDRDRAVKKWIRPESQLPGGTLMAQVILAEPALGATLEGYKLPVDLLRLPPPPPENAHYVGVVQIDRGVSTKGPQFADQPTQTLAEWQLPNGSKIFITFHSSMLSPRNILFIQQIKKTTISLAHPNLISEAMNDVTSEPRGFITIDSGDGIATFLDFNLRSL